MAAETYGSPMHPKPLVPSTVLYSRTSAFQSSPRGRCTRPVCSLCYFTVQGAGHYFSATKRLTTFTTGAFPQSLASPMSSSGGNTSFLRPPEGDGEMWSQWPSKWLGGGWNGSAISFRWKTTAHQSTYCLAGFSIHVQLVVPGGDGEMWWSRTWKWWTSAAPTGMMWPALDQNGE